MNTTPIKRQSLKDFAEEQKENVTLSFSFGLQCFNINFTETVSFSDNNNFGICLFDKNREKKIYPTLKDAFNAAVGENLLLMNKYLEKDIPESLKLFKYSWLGQLSSKNQDSSKRLDLIIKNIKEYKEFLLDQKLLDAYFEEHYANYESVIEEKISITETELKIGSPIYMFQETLKLHEIENNFNNLFELVEYQVSELSYDYSFYKPIDEIRFRMSNNVDIKLRIMTKYMPKDESDKPTFSAPTLSFTKSENNGADFLTLCQGYSNHRVFLERKSAVDYINLFKKRVFEDLSKINV